MPVVLGKCRAKYITQLPFGARATEGSCAKTVRLGRQSQGNSQSWPLLHSLGSTWDWRVKRPPGVGEVA